MEKDEFLNLQVVSLIPLCTLFYSILFPPICLSCAHPSHYSISSNLILHVHNLHRPDLNSEEGHVNRGCGSEVCRREPVVHG